MCACWTTEVCTVVETFSRDTHTQSIMEGVCVRMREKYTILPIFFGQGTLNRTFDSARIAFTHVLIIGTSHGNFFV